MKLRVFTLEEPPPEGPLVELPPDQVRHAAVVLRLKPGQAVRLLAPDGQTAPAVLEEAPEGAGKIIARLNGPWRRPVQETSGPIHLAVGLVKPAAFELVVQKSVELGAASLTPLLTGRVRPQGAFKHERLAKIAAEAQKQSLRATPLDLRPPLKWAEFLEAPGSSDALKILLAPEKTGRPWPAPEPGKPLYLAVGPEGGLSPEEVQQAEEHGFNQLGLGAYVLRTETAALSALAIWGHLRGRLS